jgi:hypothetical protein
MSDFKADAIIAIEKWRDDFDRVDESSWGPDWDIAWCNGIPSVDGSAGRLSANDAMYARLSTSKRIRYGSIQFDFFSTPTGYFWLGQGGEYPFGVYVAYSGYGTQFRIYAYAEANGSVEASCFLTLSPSTWYRVKSVVSGIPGGFIGIKVWVVGDPEPDDFQAEGLVGSYSPPRDPVDWYPPEFYFSSPAYSPLGFDSLVYMDYGEPYGVLRVGEWTADAVTHFSSLGGFTADSKIRARGFTASAWINGGRSGHSRLLDHFGTQPDTVVVLDGAISKYPSGATVHSVLEDIISRLEALESGAHWVFMAAADAFIQPYFRADSVLVRFDQTRDFTCDSAIVMGKTDQPITLDSWIVRPFSNSFTASAYLIDLVC